MVVADGAYHDGFGTGEGTNGPDRSGDDRSLGDVVPVIAHKTPHLPPNDADMP